MLPELAKHRCGIDEDRGFIKRLTEGTYLAHITEHIILVLHNMVGLEISYGKAREISGDNYYVIYQYEYSNTGIEAGNIAVDLANSLINKSPFDLDLRLKALKEILMSEQLGISTLNIYNEAKREVFQSCEWVKIVCSNWAMESILKQYKRHWVVIQVQLL